MARKSYIGAMLEVDETWDPVTATTPELGAPPASPSVPPGAETTGGASLLERPTAPTDGLTTEQLLSGRITTDLVFPPDMAEEIKRDFGNLDVPLIKVPKGEYAGLVGIDAQKIKDRAYRAYHTKLLQEWIRSNPDEEMPSEEVVLGLEDAARMRAQTWFEDARQRQTGIDPNATPDRVFRLLFVDTDPEQAGEWMWGVNQHDDILEWRDRNGVWGDFVAPFLSAWSGTRLNVTDLEAGKNSVYNDGSDILAGLDWLGRVTSPFDYLATAAAAGKDKALGVGYLSPYYDPTAYWAGWGTDDHLERLRQGQDKFAVADEIGLENIDLAGRVVALGVEKMLTSAGVESAEGWGDAVVSAKNALLLSFVEPDLLSLATLGTAKVARPVVGAALRAAGATADLRLAARGKALHAAAEALAADLLAVSDDAPGLDPNYAQQRVNVVLRELEGVLGKAQTQALATQLAAMIGETPRMDVSTVGRIQMAMALAADQAVKGGSDALRAARSEALGKLGVEDVTGVAAKRDEIQQRIADLEAEALTLKGIRRTDKQNQRLDEIHAGISAAQRELQLAAQAEDPLAAARDLAARGAKRKRGEEPDLGQVLGPAGRLEATGGMGGQDARRLLAEGQARLDDLNKQAAALDAQIKQREIDLKIPARLVGDDEFTGEWINEALASLPKLKARLATVDLTPVQADALLLAEKNGRARKGVLSALESYRARLDAPKGRRKITALDEELRGLYGQRDALNQARKEFGALGLRDQEHVRLAFGAVILNRAQLEHATAAGILSALESARDLTERLAGLSRGAVKTATPDEVMAAADELESQALQLAKAQQDLWEAGTYAEFVELEKRATVAMDRYAEVQSRLARMDAGQALLRLEEQIENARLVADDAESAVMEAFRQGELAGYEYVAKARKEHEKIVEGIRRASGTAASERQSILGAAVAMKSMGDEYLKLSDIARERGLFFERSVLREAVGGEVVAPLARNAETAYYFNRAMTATGFRRVWFKMADMFSRFMDPAVSRTAMLTEDANQGFATSIEELNRGNRELTEVIGAALDGPEGSRAAAAATWVDTLSPLPMKNGTTLLNTGTGHGRTRWQQGYPMFRAAVLEEVAGVDLPFAQGLYRAWLPKGTDTRGLLGALDARVRGALKAALEQAEEPLTFLDVMGKGGIVYRATAELLAERGLYGGVGGSAVRARSIPQMDAEIDRAISFGAFLVNEAATIRSAGDDLRRMLAADYASPAFEAARKIVGDPRGISPVASAEEVADAFEILADYGLDITRTRAQGTAKDLALTMARLGDPKDEEAVFLSTAWTNELHNRIKGFIKQEQAYAGSFFDPVENQVKTAAREYLKLWNASLIQGLVLPRPMHFVNILFGNFAQVWGTLGPAAAGRYAVATAADIGTVAVEKMGKFLPFGRYVDEGVDAMRQAMGGKHKALPSGAAAALHPDVSMFFDAGRYPNELEVVGTGGRRVTLGEIRQAFRDERIFSNFTSSSGLADVLRRRVEKTVGKRAWELLTTGGRFYAEVAEAVEQRQRVQMFTQLVLSDGKSFAEAGRLTREALYDWSYPLTQFETEWFTSIFMFYTFQRRALEQAARVLFDPVMRASDMDMVDAVRATATGSLGAPADTSLKTTNLRDMINATKALRSAFSPGDEPVDLDGDGEISADEEYAHLLRRVYPWYSATPGSRFHFANLPVDQQDTAHHRRWTGRNFTHEAYTLPSFTPVEMTGIYLRAMSVLAAFAVGNPINAVRETAGLPTRDAPTVTQTVSSLGGFVADMGGPLSGDLMKTLVAGFTGDSNDDQYRTRPEKGVRVTRGADKAILAFLESFMPGAAAGTLIWDDEVVVDGERVDTGAKRVHPGVLALYRLTPVIGNEIPNTLEPVLGMPPSRKENVVKMMGWLVGQYLGIGKAAFHEPLEVIKWDERGMEEEVRRLEMRVEREPYGVPEMLLDEGVDPAQTPTALDRFGGNAAGGAEDVPRIRPFRPNRQMIRALFDPLDR